MLSLPKDPKHRTSYNLRSQMWSPLPCLRIRPERHTQWPSESPRRLTLSQVERWEGFEEIVIDRAKPLGDPPRNFNPTLIKDYYGTGNETAWSGNRPDGSHKPKAPEEKEKAHKGKKAAKEKEEEYNSGDNSLVPDLIMLTDDDEGTIRIVGEMRFHLTSKPHKNETGMELLARKLGQLCRYMDDFRCRFRFFSTCDQTLFVASHTDDRFLVSSPINADVQTPGKSPYYANASSTSRSPRARKKMPTIPFDMGSRWSYIMRQPFRTGKSQKIAEWDNLEESYDYGKVGVFLDDVEAPSDQEKADN